MSEIVDHNDESYKFMASHLDQADRYNGAFYYSQEIVEHFIPNIETDYNWITVNVPYKAFDHSIVFIHNNREPEKHYSWLKDHKDLILVCSVPRTMERVKDIGRPIYLPLSVDVEYVKKFKKPYKTRQQAFVGRLNKRKNKKLPRDIDIIGGLPRDTILQSMSHYQKVYAVGRCAIEAKVLGCEIGVYDDYYPDPDFWQIYDSREAAKELQRKLKEEEWGKTQ